MIAIKFVPYNLEVEAIRRSVFQQEQGVSPELEFDGLDFSAVHLLAYLNGSPVGTARLRHLDEQTVKIERLAVLPSARGQGIGTQLMKEALVYLKAQNYQTAVVHAQEYVKSLYEKLGFTQVGNIFEEAGIPHLKMSKKL